MLEPEDHAAITAAAALLNDVMAALIAKHGADIQIRPRGSQVIGESATVEVSVAIAGEIHKFR